MAKLTSKNNKALGPWASVPFSPKLGYYDGSTKWYYPLIKPNSTLTWGDYVYSYDKSVGDTFGISLSNTKYVVPNKRVAAVTYDIPAGTYTPSAFKNLIQKFISHNGSRAVSNSFKVTVNGQTLSLAAGTTIHYTTQGSSPWYARAVGFGERYFQVASCMDKTGFTLYKSYIVETSNSNSNATGHCDVSFNIAFRYYASFNITVETGIKFK